MYKYITDNYYFNYIYIYIIFVNMNDDIIFVITLKTC